jgi:N-acetylmuramate 1-kinase
MTGRVFEIAEFLQRHGWDQAHLVPFPADFSTRRYARLELGNGQNAILMDADHHHKTSAFVAIDKLLYNLDISSPLLLAADPNSGLVLMEDFGHRNFGQLLDRGDDAKLLYFRAVDVLIRLHSHFKSEQDNNVDLPYFDTPYFITQVELFLDIYCPYVTQLKIIESERAAFREIWKNILKPTEEIPQSLVLRDYMPDNLMDLPERKDWRSTGVLDFQDAGIGPIVYDLASLCEVVRRDHGKEMMDEVINYYCDGAKPNLSLSALTMNYKIFSVQRHLRILGIIIGYVQKTGRRDKLSWLPRIWKHLGCLFEDQLFKSLIEWINERKITIISE